MEPAAESLPGMTVRDNVFGAVDAVAPIKRRTTKGTAR
jgi:hypothetical protein